MGLTLYPASEEDKGPRAAQWEGCVPLGESEMSVSPGLDRSVEKEELFPLGLRS